MGGDVIKKIKKIFKCAIIGLMVFVFGFSDFMSVLPAVFQNNELIENLAIKKANAATVTYTVPWTSSLEGFSWVLENCTGTCTQGFILGDGNPAGSTFVKIAGRNKKSSGYWYKTVTWESMGVPAGATVNSVDGKFDVRLFQETHAATHAVGLKIFDSGNIESVLDTGILDVEAEFNPTSGAWVTQNVDGAKNIASAYQASNTSVVIRMRTDVNSGNNNSAASEVRVDTVSFTIDYTLSASTTTIATGSDPAAQTIAPGASSTDVNLFTLQTSAGNEAISSVTVNLSTNSGIGLLSITDNANTVLGSTASPVTGLNTIAVSGMTASTALTAFKVRITPLSHIAMPAPAGGSYSVTAPVTAWAGPNTHAGSDTNLNVLTIDNASPGGTTGASGASGDSQINVSWNNPGDADFQQVYVYCKTASMISGEAPAEGTDPAVDAAACDGTVRLKYKGVISPQTISSLANGTTYYFRIYARDINGNFTAYSATQEVSAMPVSAVPNATSFINNTEGALLNGGRSSQQITVTGTNFGAGPSDGTANAVKIGTYIVPNGNVTTWNATTIVFSIPAGATVYGGIGANGLIVRANGNDDASSLIFYIYPNITSLSANSGQIGSTITISGDHFGASAGTAVINTKNASVGTWSETGLADVKIPGQEGAVNINGKIQLTRSDAKTSNQYPAGNFTILAPSVSGSNPASATTGQTLLIQFSGLGIDTDIGTAPVLKLTKGQPANCTASAACIFGTGYVKNSDYQSVSANFNLGGAAIGYWKIVIVNMDGQSGSFGNETTTGFYISVSAPTVTGINPNFGQDSGVTAITSIIGTNFQSDAIAKLTKNLQPDITPSTDFIYTNSTTLSDGGFDLSSKATGWWNVVVTNVGEGTSGSYGNEVDEGFEIRSAKPSAPVNMYQFKTNIDSAEPPTTNIAVGAGIGGQTAIYFRMDMAGGLTGELYYPQVELRPIGVPFTDTFIEGAGVMFNGTPVQGWVSIVGTDAVSYHWQARVRNSANTGFAVSFGGNNDPNDIDVYIDNTSPVISMGTDGTCLTAAPSSSITDLSALIQWNTSDGMSGAQSVFPGSGAWAKARVDYKKGIESWTATPLSLWENSLHQVFLSALAPATIYTFRMRSQDYVGNETISSECTFTTTSSRPIKTVEFFIGQETDSYKNLLPDGVAKKYFIITLPESPSADISVKSAFIEITGVTNAALSQTINVGFLRGNQTSGPGPAGENYVLDSDSTVTPFTILFNALNPSGIGQESMANITTGAIPYDYTLFLKGDGVTDIWLFSAKLIITYSYVL